MAKKSSAPKPIQTSMKSISKVNAPNRSRVEEKYPHKKAKDERDQYQGRPPKH